VALLDQAERLARAAIRAMPDGVYEFTDWLDDDGIDPDPIPLRVRITIAGDRLVADLTGSARQVKGGINSPLPFTKSAVYATVRHLIGGEPPNNEGYFRPIEVIAPPGTIVNPVLPAAVAARGLTGFRLANALFGALARIAPDRVFACEVGGDTGVSIGGYDAERRPFVFLEFLFGSWGGRPDKDGVDANSSAVVNFSNNPVEVIEAEYPIAIERYGFVPDSGGPGKFRGGLALVREYRFLEAESVLQLRTDRRRFLPYGLAGGAAGHAHGEPPEPGGEGAGAPRQVHDHRPPRGRLPPRPGRGGRLGRSARPRPRARPPRRAGGEAQRRLRPPRVRRGRRRGDGAGAAGGDGVAPGGPASYRRLASWVTLPLPSPTRRSVPSEASNSPYPSLKPTTLPQPAGSEISLRRWASAGPGATHGWMAIAASARAIAVRTALVYRSRIMAPLPEPPGFPEGSRPVRRGVKAAPPRVPRRSAPGGALW
jgi:hypothetical protein